MQNKKNGYKDSDQSLPKPLSFRYTESLTEGNVILISSPLLNLNIISVPRDLSKSSFLASAKTNLLNSAWNLGTLALHSVNSCWPLALSSAMEAAIILSKKTIYLKMSKTGEYIRNVSKNLSPDDAAKAELLIKDFKELSEIELSNSEIVGVIKNMFFFGAAFSTMCPIINTAYEALGYSQLYIAATLSTITLLVDQPQTTYGGELTNGGSEF